MTDERNQQDVPPEPSEVADLRLEAQGELSTLAGNWGARLASFDAASAGGVAGEQRSLLQDAGRRFARNRSAMVGLFVLLVYVILAIFVPILQDTAPATAIDYDNKQLSPSWAHPFGTDPQGRDIWLRAWIGARISLSIAFTVSLVILAVGITYGAVSGYVGGRVDSTMMRFLDALYGLPYLPFAIIMVSVLSSKFPDAPPIVYMVPALSITAWFTAARIMRGQMLSLKQNDFVEGARAAGANGFRIVFRHVVPNTIGVMIVVIFLEVPNAILGEAFLSFLGRGVQPPDPSWGVLAQNGYTYADAQPPLLWVPALLIASTVLAAIAVADGLRDALDPRGQVH
ncbi:MAG: ABC-type dipeptide/oligopeptide/nickel transport system, permease component [Thermoleophilia bacterium]|nr:ABC-type dipeptide/oligopeptide/nickel transport system, permease component [Thermoleophilia bacterium]